MTDRYRYIAAYTVAPLLTCFFILVLWYFIFYKPECSGTHCLGAGPVLIIYILFALIYIGMFLWMIGDRRDVVSSMGQLRYSRIIKNPIIGYAVLSVLWGVAVVLIRNPGFIQGSRFGAFIQGLIMLSTFLAIIAFFQWVWLSILGRRNAAYHGVVADD